ncbi:MAG: ABC transporter ATP-binding protein [Roseibacillus sp.]|mgnify:CR=1 FL=1|nr:ABC transporter ATP-binding protein [Roseibacillus sp.]|tara:strand:+ start:1805 stop:2455 length:651 start_codon:yes stop_codon:yes gene_type:complete
MIELQNVSWKVGQFALVGVNCRIPDGRYAVLMGATGCGKTTVLEIICGLRQPDEGTVLVADVDVSRLLPGARQIGYVPQDGALFPTMTVAEQIGFGLQVRREGKARIEEVVSNLAEDLGVAHLLKRKIHGLSGGERQRVALGRALAIEPRVLLLDEPISALDEDMRDDMMTLLKRVQVAHSITVLHVTHSSREAEQLADCVLQMEDGSIMNQELKG